ncbi:MAG: L-rhamnose mutarotase [Flavobacteriales bacterium]|nr:L-rhamnose mutarotase [Flavobacteriales bacterium]MBK9289309.1 L-rhamnose mutarotase [Flavobacteriales bacterium]MBL0034416.1 L-rhamnose mutarotase [Flavobacteriales bacterium]
MITCYALDLKNDPALIAAYEAWHRAVWPEVLEHLKAQGIRSCSIHRAGDRLCMMLESESGAATDGGGGPLPPRVQEWEDLMASYQQPLPFAKPGEKWVRMDRIFDWCAPK